jgi:hypothetical protein
LHRIHCTLALEFEYDQTTQMYLHLPLCAKAGDTKILMTFGDFETSLSLRANWTRIIGLNLAWVLADEIDTVAPSIASKAFPKILGRLRAGNIRQFGAASTPEGFRWMFNTFASEDALARTDRKLIKMRTQDNPYLPPDFIERLASKLRPKYAACIPRDGDFVNLTTGTDI